MAKPQPPNPGRYITTNDENGLARFSNEHPESLPVKQDMHGTLFRVPYVYAAGRPSIAHDADVANYAAVAAEDFQLVRPGTLHIIAIDTPPSGGSPMHRTESLDMIVVVSGEVELALDSGESRLLKAGDFIVQRNTMHKWRNVSDTDWARMYGFITAVDPQVTPDGRTLAQEFRA